MLSCLLLPGEDGALIQPKGGDDGLRRAAKRQQSEDDHHQSMGLLQIKERCALGGGEGATTTFADVTVFDLALDADVASSEDCP